MQLTTFQRLNITEAGVPPPCGSLDEVALAVVSTVRVSGGCILGRGLLSLWFTLILGTAATCSQLR